QDPRHLRGHPADPGPDRCAAAAQQVVEGAPLMSRVKIGMHGAVARVTLNRADKHNAMDPAMLDAVREAAKKLRKDRRVRAIILRGDGPSFCSGLDIRSMFSSKKAIALGLAAVRSPLRNRFQDWSINWREVAVPVIACIHGNCFGAGFQLALGADFRIS